MSNFQQLLQIKHLESLSLLTIYRILLKNMKFYPSRNRHEILVSIQQQFRQKKSLNDQAQILKYRKKAEMGLRHVIYYIQKNKQLLKNEYHNNDFIQPFAKKKDDVIYF